MQCVTRSSIFFILVMLAGTIGAFFIDPIPVRAEEIEPSTVLKSAVAAWDMSSSAGIATSMPELKAIGAITLGEPLQEDDRAASLNRGGDGRAARLNGGWMMVGDVSTEPPSNPKNLSIRGDQFSWLIRFKCDHAKLWTTRGFFTQGGGHDSLSFNLFSYDFGKGREGMRVGFEIGVESHIGLGGQVTALVGQIGPTDWHDLIVRYDGKFLELFIDGVSMDRQSATGNLRSMNTEPIAIGASTSRGRADNPFVGLIDHAAMWNRALSDNEVTSLSGGIKQIEIARTEFNEYQPSGSKTNTNELVLRSRQLKERFQQDHLRPRFHFVHFEEGDAMPGDANGAIWWNGRYHMFYIFQRPNHDGNGVVHCWGHASSVDLNHWEHHPTGLDVASDDPDRGIFSGNAFISRDGVPTIMYHGVGIGNCIAQSHDPNLITWTKSKSNPIVPLPKPNDALFGKFDSWDPHGWFEDNHYYAIFGGNPGTGAPPSLFRGPELNRMTYQGPFLKKDIWSEKDEDVSCPDFFSLDDRHVLCCISHKRGGRCFIGKWNGDSFEAESHVRMNWPGGAFFAPESLVDDKQRRLVWAWCMDERDAQDRIDSGWSGVLSLPRVLKLSQDHELLIEPPSELEQLRYLPHSISSQTLEAKVGDEADRKLDAVDGAQLELDCEFQPTTSTYFGLRVLASSDRTEQTEIGYDPKSKTLKIDVSRSSLDPTIRYKSWCLFRPVDEKEANQKITVQEVPLDLKPGEPLRLRVFIDHSIIEVFANGRQCATQRVWPTRKDSTGVYAFAKNGAVVIPSIRSWKLASTTPD